MDDPVVRFRRNASGSIGVYPALSKWQPSGPAPARDPGDLGQKIVQSKSEPSDANGFSGMSHCEFGRYALPPRPRKATSRGRHFNTATPPI